MFCALRSPARARSSAKANRALPRLMSAFHGQIYPCAGHLRIVHQHGAARVTSPYHIFPGAESFGALHRVCDFHSDVDEIYSADLGPSCRKQSRAKVRQTPASTRTRVSSTRSATGRELKGMMSASVEGHTWQTRSFSAVS